MFRILPRRIILTKGDTAQFGIDILDEDGNKYTPTDEDVLAFTVRHNENASVAFTLNATDNLFNFIPSTTSSLTTGLYVCDIQLTKESGAVYTVWSGYFELEGEITQ